MRIAIVGAGAMGSVYAALLADAGNDVVVVDVAEEHVAAIRRDGLRVEGASGERTVRVGAVTDPAEAGTVDLAVVATKAMDAPAAAAASLPLLEDTSVVLTIQNGRGAADAVAGIVGAERLLVGVAGGFGASLVAPGHVRHEGMELVRLGEAAGGPSERLERVAATWRAAGFTVEACADIERVVWEKLICNASFSGPCAILDLTIGEVLADADARALSASCAAEGYEVATALGVELPFADPVAHVAAFGAKIPAAYPSLVQDLRAGRRTEIDVINGEIPRAGGEVGVPAPVNAAVTSIVRALERARGLRP